jgi:hypothetical protein
MWYNRTVQDSDGNILINEKYYVEEVYNIQEPFGLDVMGNWVEEWWSEN